ncbi:MAG: hypothetical protein ABL996_00925 [Micropepsaceae bacterium]
MKTPQFAGLGVTTLVVLGVDLPVDWLCALAVFCGALATYVATYFLKAPR